MRKHYGEITSDKKEILKETKKYDQDLCKSKIENLNKEEVHT